MIGMVFVGQQQFVVEAHHVEDGGERLVIGAVDGRCAEAGWIQFVERVSAWSGGPAGQSHWLAAHPPHCPWTKEKSRGYCDSV